MTVPKLRFPKFRDAGEWNDFQLCEISERITEKVGKRSLITASITAGNGFVSQAEKFSRDISGEQYKNYVVLNEGEFSYNKGNSKKFSQGCIYKLTEFKQVAVPNAFMSFRFKQGFIGDFYQGYFNNNFHGLQLAKFITSGARSDGLLNISANDFFSICLPTPKDIDEQQKIADCLASIDLLITTETQKFNTLKAHKKGLMQQLFSAEGETLPKLRFSEFHGAPRWINTLLGNVSRITSGGTPNRSNKEFWNGNIPWVTTSLIDFNTIYGTNEYISEIGLKGSSAKIFPKNTILMAMYGQGKTRGKVAILGIEATTNQACAAILLNKELCTNFVFQNFASRYDEIRELSNRGGQENLSGGLIEAISVSYPIDKNEQRKIADCLSSLDDLITAQTQKIATLKTHKKGLMQQLFPTIDEVKE